MKRINVSIVGEVICEKDGHFEIILSSAPGEKLLGKSRSKTQTIENKTFDEVIIYDFDGTLIKYQPFNKVKTANINTAGLSTGTYILKL